MSPYDIAHLLQKHMRRTRSIDDSDDSDSKENSDILDHLHCDMFHHNPYQSFRQMFMNRSRTDTLRIGNVILRIGNVPKLPKLYEELRSKGRDWIRII